MLHSLAVEDEMSNVIDHVSAIQKYISVINHADDMHALIIEGSAGWGKTTAVEKALYGAGIDGIHLGAYSSPLNLYHFLYDNQDSVVLLDDCAGLFNDKASMAILKSATWSALNRERKVKWGSTSLLVETPSFEFTGKLIIICNIFPRSPDGEAIRSRSYVRKVDVSVAEAKSLIMQAACDPNWFTDTNISIEVAEFLVEHLNDTNLSNVSFRSLKKGYHLASMYPDAWKELFTDIIPTKKDEQKQKLEPMSLINSLIKQNLQVKEQARIFQEQTGLSLRTFYTYRKAADNQI